jgi:hypothetical protein
VKSRKFDIPMVCVGGQDRCLYPRDGCVPARVLYQFYNGYLLINRAAVFYVINKNGKISVFIVFPIVGSTILVEEKEATVH